MASAALGVSSSPFHITPAPVHQRCVIQTFERERGRTVAVEEKVLVRVQDLCELCWVLDVLHGVLVSRLVQRTTLY